MKNIKSTITAITCSLALLIGGTLFAIPQQNYPEKDQVIAIHFNHSVVKKLSEALNLEEVDLWVLNSELEEAKAITLTYAEEEMDLTFDDNALYMLGMEEDIEARQLEDWMFEDLATPEAEPQLEDWMFADDYFDSDYESNVMEDWMFAELIPEEECPLEDWMFEALELTN